MLKSCSRYSPAGFQVVHIVHCRSSGVACCLFIATIVDESSYLLPCCLAAINAGDVGFFMVNMVGLLLPTDSKYWRLRVAGGSARKA